MMEKVQTLPNSNDGLYQRYILYLEFILCFDHTRARRTKNNDVLEYTGDEFEI